MKTICLETDTVELVRISKINTEGFLGYVTC